MSRGSVHLALIRNGAPRQARNTQDRWNGSTSARASIGIPLGTRWTLTVEPEQPPPPDGNGSDANAITLQIPESFEVVSTGQSTVNGSLVLRGFGSDLEFPAPNGAPFADADSITFPYNTANAQWSIDGNLSVASQITGESLVPSAGWTLPVSNLPLNTFGEAAHGGSLRLRLRDQPESRIAGASGTFMWADGILNANATGLSLETRQAMSSARSELDLWTPAHTAVVFNQQSLSRLSYLSLRSSRDIALVSGGEIRNRWDLPLTAAGKPFSYKGHIELFAVISESIGLLRVTGSAIQQPEISQVSVAYLEPQTTGLGILVLNSPPADAASWGNLLLGRTRMSPPQEDLFTEMDARTLFGEGSFGIHEVNELLLRLGLHDKTPLTTLAVELFTDPIPPDPLGQNLGHARMLRVSRLVPVPDQC